MFLKNSRRAEPSSEVIILRAARAAPITPGGGAVEYTRDRALFIKRSMRALAPATYAPDAPIADDLLRNGLGPQLDAGLGDIFVEDFSSPLVQLSWQEPAVSFQERHIGPLPGQSARRFQAQQTTADGCDYADPNGNPIGSQDRRIEQADEVCQGEFTLIILKSTHHQRYGWQEDKQEDKQEKRHHPEPITPG